MKLTEVTEKFIHDYVNKDVCDHGYDYDGESGHFTLTIECEDGSVEIAGHYDNEEYFHPGVFWEYGSSDPTSSVEGRCSVYVDEVGAYDEEGNLQKEFDGFDFYVDY